MGSSERDDAIARQTREAGLRAAFASGWTKEIGLEPLELTPQRVVAQWDVDARHVQPHGIVHGGVYASVIETCCSVGALLAAPAGMIVVGVENHTSFVRSVREGRLTASAAPLHAGRRAQLWECAITDAAGRLIASGRLRLMALDAKSEAVKSEATSSEATKSEATKSEAT